MSDRLPDTPPNPIDHRGLYHVAIIASDADRSLHFYTIVLGFKVIAREFRAARNSWKIDLEHASGLRLELFSFPDAPARPTYPEARGLRHLALRTPNLDEAVAALAHHGITPEPTRLDAATGKRFTFFPDPDGLPIELYEQ